jgi:ribosomal protein S18 acetylase RimI-like enzyme
MRLIPIEDAHLAQMMTWFPDADATLVWGGTPFRFPFDAQTFREDTHLELPSFALVGDDGAFAGFGQYYRRLDRCHLARLAVAPHARGSGCGTALVRELSAAGRAALGVSGDSLFVLEHNQAAYRLYRRLGFADATYPAPLPPAHRYLVRDQASPDKAA